MSEGGSYLRTFMSHCSIRLCMLYHEHDRPGRAVAWSFCYT